MTDVPPRFYAIIRSIDRLIDATGQVVFARDAVPRVLDQLRALLTLCVRCTGEPSHGYEPHRKWLGIDARLPPRNTRFGIVAATVGTPAARSRYWLTEALEEALYLSVFV